MSNLTWDCLVNQGGTSQTAVGSALASSTTLTDISAGGNTLGQALTFKGGSLHPGAQFRVRANGIVSNTGTPTLLLGLYWGGVVGVALASTGAATTVASLSNTCWVLDALLRVDAEGTSGSIRTIGTVFGPYSATGLVALPASSSSGNNVTVDTSVDKILTIGGQWGTSSASNTVQVIQFCVERLNEGAS